MEKTKRWQRSLIIAVILLTIYNILPTVFFYTKPLKSSIDQQRAHKISSSIAERVNDLESESIQWLKSFSSLLNLKPQSISLDENHPQFISLTFKNLEEANKFRRYLPRAGTLIPFVPKQLSLYEVKSEEASKTVTIQRRIPLHFNKTNLANYFQFSEKKDAQGNPTTLYRALVFDRALQLGNAIAGNSENAQLLQAATTDIRNPQSQDLLLRLSQNIISFINVFGENSDITTRYLSSYSQTELGNKERIVQDFTRAIEQLKDQMRLERISLQSEGQTLQAKGSFLDTNKQQRLQLLLQHEKTLSSIEPVIKKYSRVMASGKTPLNYTRLGALLEESALNITPETSLQVVSLEGYNPFVKELVIDWKNEKIDLNLYPDLLAFKEQLGDKNQIFQRDQVDQSIYNEIAYDSRQAGEHISPIGPGFQISLSDLQDGKSFLALRLSTIATERLETLKEILTNAWQPKFPDLSRDVFPIVDYQTYLSLPPEQKQLALVLYSPALYNQMPPSGFRTNSVYIIAKGLDKIVQRLSLAPQSEQAQVFYRDIEDLKTLLQNNGLFGYPGNIYPFDKEFAHDIIFEGEDYFQTVLKASREDFSVHGTKRYATLEFSNVEQRILTENKIDTRMHEDLLKWRDDYRSAQLKLKGTSPYDVPSPTRNVFLNNLKLSAVKYFRGDERKILHWGLDLSGGKTVQIELRDSNHRIVTNDADIKQGINELYNRVNKMGVSEVGIRQEGHFITLDFPGSQGLSAHELVKASSMYFHVVNEKFNGSNPNLADASARFLQDIWNEAVVTGRKSVEDLNLIAWKHLHGDSLDPDVVQPRSEAAKILYDNGLRLSNPVDPSISSNFNDAYSQIALIRGNDYTEWHGQTHPLMIVFRNYALEGANLKNVRASYDPSKGNFLAFEVKGSVTLPGGQKLSPQEDLYAWTSQFSREKISGTPNAQYSQGTGWRMAVVLNGTIISAPTLDSPLKDSAMITGSFTQREVNQLEADLKAGSLSFTPHILSEKNVSPELGTHERMLGILATVVALALVVFSMVGYYRFAGLIASIAVIFNLLIMWATLQNLSATLTLATIAGIILTVGMAVDANVLVFERFREEFNVTGRLASSIHAGYRKAFSAILDSNVTTIIAALILLHFDSGPIKGFAISLIIGIVSSMFTALFMTRYFFTNWVKNPEHKKLSMASFIKTTKFDFLKWSKVAFIVTGCAVLIGGFALIKERHSILGMDFTGGYTLTVELKPKKQDNYRAHVEQALINSGLTAQDFQIRELTPSNHIRLFLSKGLEQGGKPFAGMPTQYDLKDYTYLYELNPRITWVIQTLQKDGIELSSETLPQVEQTWNEISGQLSDSMRNSAIIGLAIALICILIYITIRFEFKYAISATLCLVHDVIMTLAAIAILHALNVPIQIDLNTVAALMTIIGYSLNDTIIIFDRIREDIRVMRKSSFKEIVNHALNVTLSRTVMTSGTTFLVLLPLVLLGGSTIFGFALVMIIGIVFGTLSSLFIAAPLLHYFHERKQEKERPISQVIV